MLLPPHSEQRRPQFVTLQPSVQAVMSNTGNPCTITYGRETERVFQPWSNLNWDQRNKQESRVASTFLLAAEDYLKLHRNDLKRPRILPAC
ncbi:putative WD repeat-containing protein C2A9.03 [Fusarium oxysporum f. sp. albedinis]|nr:putative WD repeat-containing protein C2A9.03 [Fusarium oxysporum f. sp. albedinis]